MRLANRLPVFVHWAGLVLALLFLTTIVAGAQTSILNVSYDVSRELYRDINPAFIVDWRTRTGETVTINQSHGGSSRQALAVANGLEADVVTMNQAPDIDILAAAGLLAKNWRDKFPHGSSPYTTTSVFLVRKGNPKAIRDWPDLTRSGVAVILPNPKTSGNGRYTYLAAWGYALKTSGNEAGARAFVAKLVANVPVLDAGGRGATTTFTQRGIGDVLVTFENEAILIEAEVGGDHFEIVYPSLSIAAAPPVAVVDAVVDRRGTRKVAEAYLHFLFAPAGQEIIAKHHLRPRDPTVMARVADRFPPVATFTVEEELGGWEKVQREHFADGGVFDQISVAR